MLNMAKTKKGKESPKEKETNKGTLSQLGKGIRTQIDPQTGADVLVDTNLMTASIYDTPNINTSGLRNVGDYKQKREDLLRPEQEHAPIVKDISIEKTKGGILVKGDATEGELLNILDTKPKPPRTPKILAFQRDISPEDTHKVLLEANNRIIENNIAKKRLDSLNIITVPEEEFNRRAILGEVENQIFGSFGKKKVDISLKDQANIIQRYKLKIELAQHQSRLDDASALQKKLQTELRLPKTLEFDHPYEKIRELDDDGEPTGKLRPKKVTITDIQYDILHDPASTAKKPSIYSNDESKLFVKGGKVTIIGEGDEIELDNADFSKEILFDCGTDDPSCGSRVLNEIYSFQPEQVDLRRKDYDILNETASGTTRIGTESTSKPYMPKELKDVVFDPNKNEKLKDWLKNPDHLIRFENYKKQLDEFEKTSDRIPMIQCENGKVQVRRKRSPQAWGMTPKQKTCKLGDSDNPAPDTLLYRKDIRDNEIENQKIIYKQEVKTQNRTVTPAEIETESAKRTDIILNADPDYKKMVGCNTQEEAEKILDIEVYNDQAKENKEEQRPPYKVPMRFPTKNAMGDTTYCKGYKNTNPNVKYALFEHARPLLHNDENEKTLFNQFITLTPDSEERRDVYNQLKTQIDPQALSIIENRIKLGEKLSKEEIGKIRGETKKLATPKVSFREETKRKKSFLLLKQDADKI